MKIAIRVLNIIIMAISVAAGIFLFMPPAFSFNSKVTINVATFSQFVPETEYSKDIDIPTLLGTDSIYVGVRFQLDVPGIADMKDGDKEKINEKLIADNLKEMIGLLHEPVDLITDFTIRANIKRLVQEQITANVDQAVQTYNSKTGNNSKTEDVMEEVGINDAYFTNFANALYSAANSDGATVDYVNEVLLDQVNEALKKAEESGAADTSSFGDSQKEAMSESFVSIFTSLNLIEEDGVHLKKISAIAYMYLADYLKGELKSYDEATLARKSGENDQDYADRLLELFVKDKMPDLFYQIVGYVSLGLFIGLFVFAGVWAILFLITIIKTFTKKPWTMFGFWFWIVGIVELVVGFGLTAITKLVLSKFDVSQFGLPIKEVLISIKTYALIPSILFAVMIVVGIVYAFIRSAAKKLA
ncbi:MAG: hypothetical protein J6X50_05300 [Bacilli bacterium]|nr:hypothetical protein [Bacilli bacterium]